MDDGDPENLRAIDGTMAKAGIRRRDARAPV